MPVVDITVRHVLDLMSDINDSKDMKRAATVILKIMDVVAK